VRTGTLDGGVALPWPPLVTRKLLILPLAALVAAGLIACGGGGSNEDPQKVLDETFQGGKDYSSGNLDLSFKLNATGAQSGGFDATIKGPFQNDPGNFPQFDLSADVNVTGSGQNLGFQGGLTSTGDKTFVNFQDTNYEVDASTFNNFKSLFLSLESQNKAQTSPGLDTSQFFTDLSNDGTEDVNGTSTIHVSGKVDVAKFIDTVKSSGATKQLPGAAQLDQLQTSVKNASFDVFSSKDSKQLQKIDVNLDFEPPASTAGGGAEKITIDFSLGFSDLGQPQSISAPANAQPLSVLLNKYGINLSGLGSALQGAAPSTGGGTGTGTGASATPTPPSNGQSSAYLDCLSKARGDAAVQACSSQLQ
jgi:hypothetical protein